MSWHSLPIFRDNDLYVDFNMLWEVGGYGAISNPIRGACVPLDTRTIRGVTT